MKHVSIALFLLIISCSLAAQQIDVYQRPVSLEPDRDFNVIHYRLKLEVDIYGKQLKGQNTITLTPLRGNLNYVTLDAESLVVTDVLDIKGTPLSYEQKEDKLHITLSRYCSYTDTIEFSVNYLVLCDNET